MTDKRNVPLALLLPRITLFAVMPTWTIDKLRSEESAIMSGPDRAAVERWSAILR